jgi:hypothetical protein
VAALSLAFDCAEIAKELSPEVRSHLDDLAAESTAASPHPQRRLLLVRVAIARAFRQRIWLGGEKLCIGPVTRLLFRMFFQDQHAGNELLALFQKAPDEAASGLGRKDVTGFVEWVNGLADDGVRYRLPTADELVSADLPDHLFDDRLVWVAADGTATLWNRDGDHDTDSPGARDPGSPTADDIVVLVWE